jgi:hypothetical protein
MGWTRLSLALLGRAVVNPRLARALLVVSWRFRDRHWYRKAPFLPVPARSYTRWRMHTAYGDPDTVPSVEETIRYVRWAAGERRG